MKKIYGILILASLAIVSCQKDTVVDQPTNQEKVAVSFTTKLPKAIGELTTYGSGDGAITNIDFTSPTGCNLRYIMRVYDASGVLVARDSTTTANPANPVSFSTRLVPAIYKVVFWADIVPKGSTADKHYNTANIKNIRPLSVSASTNTEERDAYTLVQNVDLTGGPMAFSSLTLTRPLGKVRLLATGRTTPLPTATLNVSYDSPSFNALTGAVVPGTTPLAYNGISVQNDFSGGKQTLFSDYIFSVAPGTLSIEAEMFSGITPIMANRTISNIPVEANKLTTISGSFNIVP